jgi:hypothetical protein
MDWIESILAKRWFGDNEKRLCHTKSVGNRAFWRASHMIYSENSVYAKVNGKAERRKAYG